ncbi:glycoside hydrolase family 16 protein [Xanthomonas cannabis]|uniref:glycoside hydrolase family 16 protein n=1 Tax=Xanthomonas cannabis TaxID=1885674 RepID=UPI00141ABC16|nr:glycoside hydrolase family 16 protein [Xanthomonas cannabis]NIJ99640.1 beta-glucanase (GH16 family) [Xanthomonas cannabis]NIK63101.1 beta-glucanase (GH16 family) [Xanthomonas cannabis]
MRALRSVTVQFAVVLGMALTPGAHAQTLVWEDNFNGPGIDGGKWTYDVGNGCQIGLCGWGNGEMQYYTSRPDNARIENGRLVIEARREAFGGMPFTSARLKTEGRMHFQYGTLEARIKTPVVGNGLWPAYWMLGTIGVWPGRGEIDLMEAGMAAAIANGTANRRIGAAVHWDYNGSQADYDTSYTSSVNLHNDFHVYRMTWDPQFIRISIDGQHYFEFAISNIEGASLHEFHQQHYLLLNLAVGGTYTGVTSPAAVTAPLPGKMEVDYIRLYQNPGAQLYVGNQHAAPAGRFGVFTDQTDTSARLTLGQDAELYLWNNLTPIAQAPFEGRNVMAYRANAGAWYGLGIQSDYRNLAAYAGGALKLQVKTTTASSFRIGINTSFGDSWVAIAPGGNQYGVVRDGAWHEVTIPLGAFHDLDLQAVRQPFMLAADAPAAPVEIAIDQVYYQSR